MSAATTVAAAVLVRLAVAVDVDALGVTSVAGSLCGVITTRATFEARTYLRIHGDSPESTDCHDHTFR